MTQSDSWHLGYFLGLAESLKISTEHPTAELLYNALHSFVHNKKSEDETENRIQMGKELSY